ncbi:hypothetical protein MRY16398_24760 [Phytobacter sp. MRY16-398]|nr:hypothetical protein MRY16398_24760 [Phytobacter sp. MRY16-398]
MMGARFQTRIQLRIGVICQMRRRGCEVIAILFFLDDELFYWIIIPGNGNDAVFMECEELSCNT